MKRENLYFGIIIMILVCVIALEAYNSLNNNKEENEYLVTVIVDDSSSDRWTSFREGIEQGAKDYNIRLNVVSTGKFGSAKDEYQIVNREIDNSTDGIIIEMYDSSNTWEELESIKSRLPVIFVETDIMPEEIYTTVAPNNYEIGKDMANTILKNASERKSISIGILSGNQNQLSLQKRLNGFKDTVENSNTGTKCEIKWEISSAYSNGINAQNELNVISEKQKLSPVDVIVSLENDKTELAIDYLLSLDNKVSKLYGVGCSEKNVYYLDKGLVDILFVPNEFNMGYQSIKEMAGKLKFKNDTSENILIGYLKVDKENLYEENYQKVLFPIVQ